MPIGMMYGGGVAAAMSGAIAGARARTTSTQHSGSFQTDIPHKADLSCLPGLCDSVKQFVLPHKAFSDLKPMWEGGLGPWKLATTRADANLYHLSKNIVLIEIEDLMDVDGIMDSLNEALPLVMATQHPNVASIYGLTDKPISLITQFKSGKRLSDMLYVDKSEWTPAQQHNLVVDLAEGLRYLHRNDVFLKYLCVGNVLITENWDVVMTQVGLHELFDAVWIEPEDCEDMVSEYSGLYHAPEICEGSSF